MPNVNFYSQDYDDIVNILINERKKLNMSQEELALKCGIAQSSVCRVENNKFKTSPPTETICKMARALGMQLALVMEESGYGY